MGNRTIRRELRHKKKSNAGIAPETNRFSAAIAFGLLLVLGTLILYSPMRAHDFINYDDDDYVINNPHVTAGLNWQTIRWSFTSTEQSNWHPLTWLSHTLDCQLFGLDAGYHHLTSAVIHALNVT